MKVTKKDEPAPRKFQYWVGWNNKGTEQVVNFLNAKKLPLSTPPLMRYAGLRGVNSSEFPILNDISEQAFKNNKLKNVSDFEEQFLKEALKSFGLDEDHYDNEHKNTVVEQVKDSTKPMVPVSNNTDHYLPPRKIKAKLGIANDFLRNMRLSNPEICIKVGNGYRYHEQKLINLLNSIENQQIPLNS